MSKPLEWIGNSKGYFLALLSLALLSSGCSRHDGPRIEVTFEFVAPAGTPPLSYIEVMAGGDKTHLGNIAPGRTKRVVLDAFEGPGDNGVVLYITRGPTSGDTYNAWSGERMDGEKSYKTHIQINEKAQVISQRSCVMPCELKK